MKLALRLVACAVLAALSPRLAAQPSSSLPSPTEKKIYKEVGDVKLEIWIWKPAGWNASDQRSAIVFYHGGGWRNGSPNAFARQSAKLAERGMVTCSVQYRLTSQSGVTVADCVKPRCFCRSRVCWINAAVAAWVTPGLSAPPTDQARPHP